MTTDAERAREVLAEKLESAGLRASASSVRDGSETCAVHIWPVLEAMLAFAAQPHPEVEIPEYPAGDISHLEGLAVLLDGYSRDRRREGLPRTANCLEEAAGHLRCYDRIRTPSSHTEAQREAGEATDDWTGGRAWPELLEQIAQYWADFEEERAGSGANLPEELAEESGHFANGLADHLGKTAAIRALSQSGEADRV